MLPAGHYSAWVSATDGKVTATQAVGFDMEAFVTKPSDTTPGRGQRISVTAVTSEALSAAAAGLHHPAGQGGLERPDDQDRDEHVQGDVHDQDRRVLGNDHLQGPGQGHRRRDQPDVQELPAPLTAVPARRSRRHDRLATDRRRDRPCPPATAPDRTRPPRTPPDRTTPDRDHRPDVLACTTRLGSPSESGRMTRP